MEIIKEKEEFLEILFNGCEKTSITGDIIVPDRKADVLKILQIDARCAVTDKGIASQGLYVMGKVYVNILYIPDSDEKNICCIDSSFDFKEKIDKENINGEMKPFIKADVSRIEFNLINSRKLSVKAFLNINYEIIGKREMMIPTGFSGESGEYIKNNIVLDRICDMEETEFAVRDSFEIASAKYSVKEIIKTDSKICNVQTKEVNGKLILKGVLDVCVLYITNENTIDFANHEFPFTEVFDFYDIEENDIKKIDFDILDINTEITDDNDGDPKVINIECIINAKVRTERKKEIPVISDCYCPGKLTELETESMDITSFVDCIGIQNNIKDIISPDDKLPEITRIYNVICEPEIQKVTPEKNCVNTEGKIRVYVLYITDSTKGNIYSMKKDISFNYSYDCDNVSDDMQCEAEIIVDNISYNINAAGEIELRCILAGNIKIVKKENVKMITNVQVHEKDEGNDIVIYFVKTGDTLFDVAKKYAVKKDDIIAVNSLENEKLSRGQKLIIPACSC